MVKTALLNFRDFTIDFIHSPVGILLSDLCPHWIAKAFEKDQYGLPIFANLILVAVPIIFIIALLVYRQRGPVLILLCLLTAFPVWSGLSHWYKSEQRNHWFGYWFGHDMFTPPFTGPDGKLSNDAKASRRSDERSQNRPSCLSRNGARRDRLWRHRSGTLLPDLHDFLRKLHSAPLPTLSGSRNSTVAMFISLHRTRWLTARIWIIYALNTTAASRLTRPSSGSF